MAVRIDGNNDLINAADGTLTIEGISVNVVGVSTASGGYKVGSAYTVFPNGNVATAGVVTASSAVFRGDANLGYEALKLLNTQHDTNNEGAAQLKFGITNSLGERNARIEAKEVGGNANDVALDFYTNSTNGSDSESHRMRIHYNGNVGLGTTVPSKLLHLSSANPVIRLSDTDTDGPLNVDIDGASGDLILDVPSVHRDVIIKSVGQTNEIARFTGDGLVGIATASPTNALDVQGGTTNTAIVARSTDSKAQISLLDNSTTSVGSVVIGAEGDALFLTSGSGGDERLRINSSGQVGIASAIPTSGFTLDVGGDLTIGEPKGTGNTFLDQKEDGDLHLINSGRTANGASGSPGTAGVGINRFNTRDGGTSVFRDFCVYNGKDTKVLVVDGSASAVGIGTDTPDGALTIAHSGSSTDFLMFNKPGSVGTFARMGHNTSSGTNMLDIRSEGHARFLTNGNNETMRLTSGNDVVIGGTTIGATGSFGVESSGAFRSILAASSASDTLLGAISGVSNGFQINIDASNNQTYKFHNGSQISQQIDSSGASYFGTTSWPTGSFGATFGRAIFGNEGLLTVYNETNGAFSGGTLKLACKEGGDATKVGFINMVGGTVNTSDQKAFFKMDVSNDAGSGVEFFRIQEGGNGGRFMLNHTDISSYNANFSVRENSSGPYPIGSIGQTTNQGLIGFFAGDGTLIGSIAKSGSSVQYNTTSDYRLKENDASISDGITRIKQLRPIRFNWKDFPEKGNQDGFFAHEVSSVVPEAVTGDKDGIITQEYIDAGKELQAHLGKPIIQSMDHSKLVPLLTAALQEEISKREALEARVAALEGS